MSNIELKTRFIRLFCVICATFCCAHITTAKAIHAHNQHYSARFYTSNKTTSDRRFIHSDKYAALVVDAKTGEVLYERNAGEPRYPASLVKMMTLYLTFEAIDQGKLSFKKCVRISKAASQQEKTNLSLSHGDCVSLKDALYGVAIKSANDMAWALAEAIAKNEKHFVRLMNRKAKQLGMMRTVFSNPNGLHHSAQVTTAYDMARLAIALHRDYGHHYKIFRHKSFIFRNKVIRGHNRVLNLYNGADGLKTGYTKMSGFNLVTSTHRANGDLVAVVFGGSSASARDSHMISLLNNAYIRLRGLRGKRNTIQYVDKSKYASDIRIGGDFYRATIWDNVEKSKPPSHFVTPVRSSRRIIDIHKKSKTSVITKIGK